MPFSQAGEHTALCATCLDPHEVTATLQELGLSLIFQMPAYPAKRWMQLPGLPAQFHYEDSCGLVVMYLAGKDELWEGQKLPEHASRFWVYAGADPKATQRVMHALETQWPLHWQRTSSNLTDAMSVQDVA